MDIMNALRKVASRSQEEKEEQMRKITADETELNWYKRREYLANVKKELQKYREEDRENIWKGHSLNDEHQIANAPNVFKKMKKIF